MTSEADRQARIMLALGSRPDVRLFRNNVGMAWQGDISRIRGVVLIKNPRPVHFGLHVGSPDTVGWQSVVIRPEHVGRRLAVFLGPEIKTPIGRKSADQIKFYAAMQRAGALGGFVRTPEEAEALLI